MQYKKYSILKISNKISIIKTPNIKNTQYLKRMYNSSYQKESVYSLARIDTRNIIQAMEIFCMKIYSGDKTSSELYCTIFFIL